MGPSKGLGEGWIVRDPLTLGCKTPGLFMTKAGAGMGLGRDDKSPALAI